MPKCKVKITFNFFRQLKKDEILDFTDEEYKKYSHMLEKIENPSFLERTVNTMFDKGIKKQRRRPKKEALK